MKTFSFSATYLYEDSGEVEAESYEEAREAIADLVYPVSNVGGYSMIWDMVKLHELEEIDDDEEGDEDA